MVQHVVGALAVPQAPPLVAHAHLPRQDHVIS